MQAVEAKVAAGLVSLACDSIARYTALPRWQLLANIGLREHDLSHPDGLVAMATLIELVRIAQRHKPDPALGLRLAGLVDLREQGFWGYAVLSSHSLRARIEAHVRYQRLRAPWRLELREDSGIASLELIPDGLPADVMPVFMEWILSTALLHLAAHFGGKPRELQLWLSYPAAAHHHELGALLEREIVFDAPCICLRVPAALLDLELPGDPKLQRLLHDQLDAQLNELPDAAPRGLIDQVRQRMAARMEREASLSQVARDLGISPRTLQRQLEAQATSFQVLLEDVRRVHALRYLSDTQHSVRRIAQRLGYADATSFRRAFRRWTGSSPAHYRTGASQPVELARDVSRPARKVSVV